MADRQHSRRIIQVELARMGWPRCGYVYVATRAVGMSVLLQLEAVRDARNIDKRTRDNGKRTRDLV